MTSASSILSLLPEDLMPGQTLELGDLNDRLQRLSRQEALLGFLAWQEAYGPLLKSIRFSMYTGENEAYYDPSTLICLNDEMDPEEDEQVQEALQQLSGYCSMHLDGCTESVIEKVIHAMNKKQWDLTAIPDVLERVADNTLEKGDLWFRRYQAAQQAQDIARATPPALGRGRAHRR